MKIIFPIILFLFSGINNFNQKVPFSALKNDSDSFEIMEGFQIELVVAEPLIRDPVAMEIDEDGNWYVAEMPGYPLDLSKTGTIKKLKDTDGDGLPDKSIVFAKGLTLPMGLMKWKKGLLVADSPNIWYMEDTDGDEIADIKEVMITGFSLSNPQHNMNTPKFGIDNWIYVGHSGAINSFAYEKVFSDKGSAIRFPNNPNALQLNKNGDGKNVRFKPDTYQLESLSGETQYGHTVDQFGHRFYTDNANHLFHEVIDARYIAQNPNLALADAMQKIPDHGDACEVFPITENPNHQLLTDVGVVTSSCGITYYDGGAFGEKFNNVTFIGEPVHNLVHADIIEPKGATFTGKRLIEKKEFLASKDPWFRPVNFYVGPDGALYLIDYYRQIVEHPEWMSDEINKSGALYNGTDKGRIYRISKKGSAKMDWFGKRNYSIKPSSELVQLLKSNNGWEKRTVQRLLFQRNDQTITPDLIKILSENSSQAKIAALWLLYDWHKITPEILANILSDPSAGVRENALQVTDRLVQMLEYQSSKKLNNQILKLANDSDPRVRFQWLCSSAFFKQPEISKLKSNILVKDMADPWVGIAAIAASKGNEVNLFDELVKDLPEKKAEIASDFISNLSATIAKAGDKTLFEKALNSKKWWQAPVYEGLTNLLKYSKKDLLINESNRISLLENFTEKSSNTVKKSIVDLLFIVGLPKNETLLKKVFAQINANEDIESQKNALALLSLSKNKLYSDKIISTVVESNNDALQQASLNALPKILDPEKISKINKSYKNFTVDSKKIWIKYLMERYDRTQVLLAELEKGNISQKDLEWPQMVHLMNYYETKTRNKARQLLSLNEDRKAILQKYLTANNLMGNANNGKKIFVENCTSCHQINGIEGVDFGPNLSTLRSRNANSIITEIINPNNSIADKYGAWDIELNNGNKINGILIAENKNEIFIKTLGGIVRTINNSEIKSKNISKYSMMPNGLENAINVEQMADLIAFIKNI
jgi:putative membrane-bound dehydrogenase-like protein